MTLQELGKHVADLRREKGFSQDEVCRITAISRTTLSQLENNELAELGYHKVLRILSLLGKDLAVVNKSPTPTLDDLVRQRNEDLNESYSLTP